MSASPQWSHAAARGPWAVRPAGQPNPDCTDPANWGSPACRAYVEANRDRVVDVAARNVGRAQLGPLTLDDLVLLALEPPATAEAKWRTIVESRYCTPAAPLSSDEERRSWAAANPWCTPPTPQGEPVVAVGPPMNAPPPVQPPVPVPPPVPPATMPPTGATTGGATATTASSPTAGNLLLGAMVLGVVAWAFWPTEPAPRPARRPAKRNPRRERIEILR